MRKKLIVLFMTLVVLTVSACSQSPASSAQNGSAEGTNETSQSAAAINNESSGTATNEASTEEAGDPAWSEMKVSGYPLYFAVPADLSYSKGWVINAYLKRDEKMVAVIATAALKTSDLDEATKSLLTNYFSDGTQYMGAWYNSEDVPGIVEKISGEKKTVKGMETYYFDTKVHFDSDLAFIGYTFIINEIPCAIIAMDLDNYAAKDAAWKEATEKELRERVEYMINHVEWRE